MTKLTSLLFIIFIACSAMQLKSSVRVGGMENLPGKNKRYSEEAQAKSLYFSHAIIYEYMEEGEKKELWFYINKKTKQVLYAPDDAMLDAVVSFPDGTYKIYGQAESGPNLVFTEKVDFVASKSHTITPPKANNKTRIIKKSTAMFNIICKGYSLKYEQMEGGEDFFVTEQMPVNSYQIFGFCRLDGDARIQLPLDFSNVLTKKQLPTEIKNGTGTIKLIDYTVSPYWFSTDGYKASK